MAYLQNYTADSSHVLHNDKDHQVIFVGGPNMRTTNSRWRTATAAILKIKKSRYLSNRLTNFDDIWHAGGGAYCPLHPIGH